MCWSPHDAIWRHAGCQKVNKTPYLTRIVNVLFSVIYLQLSLNISGDLMERLQRAQNKCIRYVTGLRRDTHVTLARWQLGWLMTEIRQMYFSAIIIYKARRIGQPKYFAELFETRRRIDLGRGDAIPEKLYSPSSEAGKKSLKYECAKFWNELPNRIRDIHSLGGLKSALFKHLFQNDSLQPSQ